MRAPSAWCVGHVGQSLDGQIATSAGASRYVTGPENIVHMHRLRSLMSVVVVGAGTVELDDPELTTRLVPGDHPTRVVIDPRLRLAHARRLYRDGARAHVDRLSARSESRRGAAAHSAAGACLGKTGCFRCQSCFRLWPRAGSVAFSSRVAGVTISHFIQARCLDRLHVTVCPILIGRGRPGISLPGVERLDQALRPSHASLHAG